MSKSLGFGLQPSPIKRRMGDCHHVLEGSSHILRGPLSNLGGELNRAGNVALFCIARFAAALIALGHSVKCQWKRDNAMSNFRANVDAEERAAFEAVFNASRARLVSTMTADCASAIGALELGHATSLLGYISM